VLILSASRIIYAMGERGDLPAMLAAVHPRHRTPVASILLTTAVMLALTLSGTFISLLTLSTLSRLITYFATCAALPLLRRRITAPAAVFLMPAGNVVASVALVLILWLLSNSTLREARDTAIAAAAGLFLYALHRMRQTQVRNSLSKNPK
jgi:basic amino acid/polyamine antiporter, APA family